MSVSLFQTKTFWVNACATIVAVGTAVGAEQWIANNPKTTAYVAAVVGVANILSRLFVSDPAHLWSN